MSRTLGVSYGLLHVSYTVSPTVYQKTQKEEKIRYNIKKIKQE